jgi:hypothetical protein
MHKPDARCLLPIIKGMTAGFQNIIEANDVALNVSIRISDRVATPA